jgi:hypothetical protein
MLIAQAEGRHPASAAIDYNIIQNKPSLKADTMLARFQGAGGCVAWQEYTDTRVVGTFKHPQGGSVTIDWDMERAKRAGLGTKENWKTYPRAMLRARVISEGIRTVYPSVLCGMYTPEEVMDFDPAEEPVTTAALPIKQPDPFEEMVLAKGIGGGMQTYLGEYMKQRAEINKKTVLEIKNKAIKHPSEFWKGFQTWLDTVGQDPDNEAQNAAID